MPTYYIVDSTIKKNKQNPVMIFNNLPALVGYLETMCKRRFNQTRAEYMFHCSELGFGEDDSAGRSFYEQLEQYFDMGIIRKDSIPVKCNIFNALKSYNERETSD